MLSRRIGPTIVAALVLCLGWPRTSESAPQSKGDLRIANVAHNGIHFSVAIDPHNNRFLEILVPEKTNVQSRPIRISLRFRDESKIEGAPEREPSGERWLRRLAISL
jgi:hypothetical protein